MTTLQQPCPACGRELELPAAAAGRLAQCPACDVKFTIGESTESVPSNDQSASSEVGHKPMMAESGSDALQIGSCPIEDVLSKARSILFARWSQFLAPLGVFIITTLIAIVMPFVVLREFWLAGFVRLTVLGIVCWAPLAFLFGTYASVAFARVGLAIAKDEPVISADIAPPQQVLFRALASAALLAVFCSFAGMMMYSFVAVSGKVSGTAVSRVLTVFAFLFTSGVTLVLFWQVWAWIYACADDRATAVGSLRAACAITANNKLTSFFLILIAVVLALTGTLMCLVGHLITAPLTNLIFAVAYLQMTGQSVADPNDV